MLSQDHPEGIDDNIGSGGSTEDHDGNSSSGINSSSSDGGNSTDGGDDGMAPAFEEMAGPFEPAVPDPIISYDRLDKMISGHLEPVRVREPLSQGVKRMERSKHVQHEYRYNQHAKVQEKYDVMEAFYAYAPSVRSVLSEAFDPEMESALQKVKQSLDTLQGPVPHPGPQVPKVVIDHLEDSVIKDKLSRKLHGLNSCAVQPLVVAETRRAAGPSRTWAGEAGLTVAADTSAGVAERAGFWAVTSSGTPERAGCRAHRCSASFHLSRKARSALISLRRRHALSRGTREPRA
ncbi:hypothetical protein PLESTF_000248400 [Pleodorina starrii]|nr:hypothetical protein PLESTF_000248400 [Pleodorina starrii]